MHKFQLFDYKNYQNELNLSKIFYVHGKTFVVESYKTEISKHEIYKKTIVLKTQNTFNRKKWVKIIISLKNEMIKIYA